jgi:hypothetical protein
MITRRNYFDFIEQNNILTKHPELKTFHDFVVEATDSGRDWSPYDEEAQTKEFIDLYFEKLAALKGNARASGSTAKDERNNSFPIKQNDSSGNKGQNDAPKSKGKRGRPKGSTKSPAKAPKKESTRKPSRGKKAKKQKKVLNLPKGKLVELVDPHLLFVGRYLRMNGQKRSRNALEKFFAQINQAADARILRKASPYSDHIIYIQKQLLKYLSGSGDEFTVEIQSGKFDELLRSVAKEQQMASVRLLKRYHNMAGRPASIEKAKKLYNELYNAIEKGKIPEKDRLFKRVTKAMRDLHDYVKENNTSAALVRLPAELGGVLGFMDGCLCTKDRQLNSLACPDDVRVKFGN